jgi:lysophospholipase L1-like esterase
MKFWEWPARWSTRGRRIIAGAGVAVLLCVGGVVPSAQRAGERWVGTWSTSEVGRPATPPPPVPLPPPMFRSDCPAPPAGSAGPSGFVHFTNQTLRQIVRTSVGGNRARIVLSNAYGTAPLTIGAAQIALRATGSTIQPGSSRPLTFNGRSTFTIPPAGILYSDPVTLAIPPVADVAIDLYLPGATSTGGSLTMHPQALQTNYVSETGNHVGVATLPVVATTASWFVLYRVEVATADAAGGLVAYGDAITDGTNSTPDTNNRWPDQLARRMLAQPTPLRFGVMNAGIAANRILNDGMYAAGSNALARFEHNVLMQPGVTHVVVMEGINDIGQARENPTPTAEDIIAGHKQIIERAHARGLTIYGATLTPFYGAMYYTEVGEQKRRALNDWIRTGHAYDGVIDFDQAIRDPNDPKKFLPAFDSCDHLHPNDAGYKAMADAVDLGLFKTAPTPTRATGIAK